MNLEQGKRYGDQAYAFNELVAELSAAFLCAELEITNVPRPDHAQYIQSWLTVLKNDTRAIFTAASLASATVDYLMALQPKALEPERPVGTDAIRPSTPGDSL